MEKSENLSKVIEFYIFLFFSFQMNIAPVIICGGFGKRLYPISTIQMPKQFITFFNRRSSFQKTIIRIRNVLKTEKIIICCNQLHVSLIEKQLNQIDENNFILIIEQEANNTFAAILSVLSLTNCIDNVDIIFVSPADSFIENEDCFSQKILDTIMYSFISKKHILLGIKPTSSDIETEYGYIQINNKPNISFKENVFYEVQNFIEKPLITKVKKLLSNDNCLWNSGHFILYKNILLQEIRKEQSESFEILKQGLLLEINKDRYVTKENFLKLRNIQFDKAIIEKSKQLNCTKANFDWLDIGSFKTINKLIIANKIHIPKNVITE